jgi:hypothetical protein
MDIITASDGQVLNYFANMGVVHYDTRNGLYKYRTINGAKRILTTNTINFASVAQLKDNFELHPSIINLNISREIQNKFLARVLNNAGIPFSSISEEYNFMRFLKSEIENLRNRVGIFSAARTATNGLLWEVYGDDSKGVCLCFKHTDLIDKLALEVNYTDIPQIIDLIDPEAGTLKPDILYWFCIKQKHYVSENEVRFIDVSKCGPARFPKTWLNEIIFGLNTKKEDQEEILKLIIQYQYPVQKIGKLTVSNDNWGYKIQYF